MARDPDPIVAIEPLQRNHMIARGDLETAELRGMQGRFLKERVGAGERVTSAMLADGPVAPVTENTAAAIVKLAQEDAFGIESGARVQLCSGASLLMARVKVISVDCDAAWCSVVVGLPTVPDALQAAGALAAASLTIDGCTQ